MARRTVKIPAVKSLEQAREVLMQMIPSNSELTTTAYLTDRKGNSSLSSYTNYSASLQVPGDASDKYEVSAHTPALLVSRFVETILPALNARLTPARPPIGRHRRIEGPTVRRLTHQPTFPDGGLFDE